MGRQVKLTILNDTSSPNQVVTNYNTLISADHVDLTFGPFSSLLTAPASAVAARNGYAFVEGAGGAPSVFNTTANEDDHNVFDVSLPIADELMPFVNYIASLGSAADHKLTAAYPMANDPFADPPVQLAQQKLAGARRQDGVLRRSSPRRSRATPPPPSPVAQSKPDIVVLGSTDVPTVQAFMKAFQQQHFTPKMFIAAAGPDQGAAVHQARWARATPTGMMVPDGWYPGYKNATEREDGHRVRRAVRRHRVRRQRRRGRGVLGRPGRPAGDQRDRQRRQRRDHQVPAQRRHAAAPCRAAVQFDSLGENGAAAAFIFQWQNNGTKFNQVLPTSDPGSVPILATKPAWTGPVG